MSNSRNSRRGSRNGHAGRELWGKNLPLNGDAVTNENKTLSRRIVRKRLKRQLDSEIKRSEDS